jgi:hypothetical protein
MLIRNSSWAVLLLACSMVVASEARTFHPGSLAARWPIKTSDPAGSDLSHPKDVPLDQLLALKDVPGVKAQDSRYQSKRIPDPVSGLHEGDIIRTKGWVHVIALEGDGDYHLQITDSPSSGNNCLIIELPKEDPAFEKNPQLRQLCANLRPTLRKGLLLDANREPTEGGNWMVGQAYMSVTGQLFFDDWHVGGPPRGKSPNHHAGHAATLWEIHPITDIRFTPKPH